MQLKLLKEQIISVGCSQQALFPFQEIVRNRHQLTTDELTAFERMAKQCRGYSEEQSVRVLDDGLRLAGYIALQAKRLSEKRLIDLFVSEAEKILPHGFALSDGEVVRKAFVMWTAMALSDGDYSSIERKAINAFLKHLDAITESVNTYNESKRTAYSPAFARAFVIDAEDFKFKSPATNAFLKKVEDVLVRLGEGDENAAKELKTLISEG